MAYTTADTIASYLGRPLTTGETAIIATVIAAVTQWINTETGVDSWEAGASGSRYYDGNAEQLLFIDPVSDITAVQYLDLDGEVNTTYELPGSDEPDFVAYPLNRTTKTYLKIITGRCWPYGSGRIKVTGTFGEGTGVPGDITLAATILASDWISSSDANLQSESIEGYSRTFAKTSDDNPQVSQILNNRRRVLI